MHLFSWRFFGRGAARSGGGARKDPLPRGPACQSQGRTLCAVTDLLATHTRWRPNGRSLREHIWFIVLALIGLASVFLPPPQLPQLQKTKEASWGAKKCPSLLRLPQLPQLPQLKKGKEKTFLTLTVRMDTSAAIAHAAIAARARGKKLGQLGQLGRTIDFAHPFSAPTWKHSWGSWGAVFRKEEILCHEFVVFPFDRFVRIQLTLDRPINTLLDGALKTPSRLR